MTTPAAICNKRSMKVLLISANTETINMPVLPLGMASVAAAAEQGGHNVSLLNLLESLDISADIRDAIQQGQPDIVGISVRNIDDQSMDDPRFFLDPVRQIVHECRINTGVPVVLGGAGYSIFPLEVLEYTGADYGIQGEGEDAFCGLLECIAARRDPATVAGVHTRGSGRENPPRSDGHLDAFPLPLPSVHIDIPMHPEEALWFPYQTRRGCPMECSYCSTPLIEGARLRFRKTDAIVDNIRRFAEKGVRRFYFVDNIFNIPESYAKDLCNAIIAADLSIRWRCIVYPTRISDSLAAAMARAGCEQVAFGYESGSPEVLSRLGKQFSPDEVALASHTLRRHSIGQMGFLLLGGPGETYETVKETLAFSDSLPLDALKITTGIRIYPRTPLAAEALREGLLTETDNLIMPRFYLRPEMAEWLPAYMEDWASERPHCMF